MNTSDALAVAGLVVSVVGIPLAYILAKRGRQRPDLRYVLDFEELLFPEDGLAAQGLFITFSGERVTRVSRSYVAFWNQRGDTVRGSDIVPGDPLRIVMEEDEVVLHARIISHSRPQTEVSISLPDDDPSAVVLDFDFLDAGDGAVVEVVYEGKGAPYIAGTVRGAIMTDRGYADLSPKYLARLADSKLRTRILARFRGHVDASILALGACGTMFGSINLFTADKKNPILVDPSKYDLQTIEGQKDFAKEIAKKQDLSETFTSILPWVLLAIAIVSLIAVYFAVRVKFPVSIASHILTPPVGEDSELSHNDDLS